jgi:hypothetical protein
MAYERLSTDNPLGWRPWNSRLSSLGVGVPVTRPVLIPARIPRRRRFLLGQADQGTIEVLPSGETVTLAPGATVPPGGTTLPNESDLKNQASGILGALQNVNQQLNTLENLVRQDPNVAVAIGAQVIAARNQYTQYASQYTQYYTLLFGSAPSGLTGLGQIVSTTALVAIFFFLASIAAWLPSIQGIVQTLLTTAATTQQQEQTAANVQSSVSTLQQQYNDAVASGDTASANIYAQEIAQQQAILSASGTPATATSTLSSLFQSPWALVLLAVGLVVLVR